MYMIDHWKGKRHKRTWQEGGCEMGRGRETGDGKSETHTTAQATRVVWRPLHDPGGRDSTGDGACKAGDGLCTTQGIETACEAGAQRRGTVSETAAATTWRSEMASAKEKKMLFFFLVPTCLRAHLVPFLLQLPLSSLSSPCLWP